MHDGLHSAHIRCLWRWFGSGNFHSEFEREGKKRRPCNPNKDDKPDLRSLRTAKTFEKREHSPLASPGGKRARTWRVELSWCREEIGRKLTHSSHSHTHIHTHTHAHDGAHARTEAGGLGLGPASCALGIWSLASNRTRADSDELCKIGEPWKRKDELRHAWVMAVERGRTSGYKGRPPRPLCCRTRGKAPLQRSNFTIRSSPVFDDRVEMSGNLKSSVLQHKNVQEALGKRRVCQL